MRKLFILLLLLIPTLLFSAAVSEEVNTRIFTDDLGREVALPNDLDKIVGSGRISEVFLLSLCPEKLVAFNMKQNPEHSKYYDMPDLKVIGNLYSKRGDALSKESLILSNPQVIIDIGEIKGSKEAMSKDFDDLSKSLGRPIVFIENTLLTTDKTYNKLYELLGLEKALKLAEYSKNVIDSIPSVKSDKTFYYSQEDNVTNAPVEGSMFSQVLELFATNVIKDEFGAARADISIEEIYAKDPDYLIAMTEKGYNNYLTDSRFASLRAVKENNVVLAPTLLYSVIDNPPAMNRLLGIYWCQAIFGISDINYEEYQEDYIKTFYGK